MKAKVKTIVKNMGNNVTAAGVVNLKFRAAYSELPQSVQTLVMLNQNVDVKAKLPGGKPFRLGWFMIKGVWFAGDGESDISLRGTVDSVEMDKVYSLPLAHDENPEFQVLFEAEIEEDVDEELDNDEEGE